MAWVHTQIKGVPTPEANGVKFAAAIAMVMMIQRSGQCLSCQWQSLFPCRWWRCAGHPLWNCNAKIGSLGQGVKHKPLGNAEPRKAAGETHQSLRKCSRAVTKHRVHKGWDETTGWKRLIKCKKQRRPRQGKITILPQFRTSDQYAVTRGLRRPAQILHFITVVDVRRARIDERVVEQPFSTTLLSSSHSQQFFSAIILLWSRVGGQLLSSCCCVFLTAECSVARTVLRVSLRHWTRY